MAAKKSSNGTGAKILAAGIAALVMAGGAKHHGDGILADLTSLGGGSLSTPAGWAHALLKDEGFPRTSCNMNAVMTWERFEGGGFGNQAAFNPLNVNPGPGAGWPGSNATGAWAFPDAGTGLKYTIRTLNNGSYGGIISALQAGDNAQAVCNAIMASPWAASHYNGQLTASC